MAGSRLESMINETLAGTSKGQLSEMSSAVLDSIIDHDTPTGRLVKESLVGSVLELTANNGSIVSQLESGSFGQLLPAATASSLSIEMGQSERLFWVLIFSVMVLVAAGGNTIVVYIVATNKEMKSVTNYFLVNLSLADTMVSTLNVIFNFISMLNSHWPFGKVYCKISNFIAILSISASVFTLTAISCDRYNAIIHPLRPRMSHRHAIAWILLIWTLSSALAMPNFIYSTDLEDRLTNDNVAVTCTMLWPDGRYPLSSYDHIYNIVILVVTYLVPILTMAILYYRVGKELWGYEAIGENIDKQQRAIMAKKKIVKMMIVVVIIFALCWLPYHAFFVVNYYMPNIFQDSPLYYQRCYLFMYWLAMSNSMYNPIIIYFMNSKVYKPLPVLRPSNATPGSNQNQHQPRTNNIQQRLQTSDNLNGRRSTLLEDSQPQTPKGPETGPALAHSNNNNSHVAIAITDSVAEGPCELSNRPGPMDVNEDEPFISKTTAAPNVKQIMNTMESNKLKDLRSDASDPRTNHSDRLIDFSTNKQINKGTTTTANNKNKNKDNNIDKLKNNRIDRRVWI